MTTIIVAVIQAIATIGVAVFTYFTNHKIEKISDVKSEIRQDIEKNRLEDIARHNETLKSIEELRNKVDQNDIDVVRNRIVAFDNLCRLDVNYDSIKQYQYATAFKDVTKWKYYHTMYKSLNGEIDAAIDNIEEHYKKANF